MIFSFDDDNADEKKLHTFLNPYSYLIARNHRTLFRRFTIHSDGISLVLALKLLGVKHVKRQSFDMTSLAPKVFSWCIDQHFSVYFIGSKNSEIEKGVRNIKKRFIELSIAGYHHGYLTDLEWDEMINKILSINPDILICGMGTPTQEQFLSDLKDAGWDGVGYTCGGFIHQSARSLEYYPSWADKYHLRWAYRIYQEPHLLKRYIIQYPKFIGYFIWDSVFYR